MVANGRIEGSGEALNFDFPTTHFEADISVDVILSFGWLVDFDVDVCGRRYGLKTNTTPLYVIPGIQAASVALGPMRQVRLIQAVNQNNPKSKAFFIRPSKDLGVPEGKPENEVEKDYWEACEEVLEPEEETSLQYLRCMRLTAEPEAEEGETPSPELDEDSLQDISKRLLEIQQTPKYIRGIVVAHNPRDDEATESKRSHS